MWGQVKWVALLVLPALLWACSGDGVRGSSVTLADASDLVTAIEVLFPQETIAQDVGLPDFGAGADQPDGPPCRTGEGCFLDQCTENQECTSGWCVEHMAEGTCTTTCVEECSNGWKCAEVNWTYPDLLFVCLSNFASLCKPCNASEDCQGAGGALDLCVDWGAQGAFCGGNCQEDQDCPDGFACVQSSTIEGLEVKQCVPQSGECPCTVKSTINNLWTSCFIVNEAGTCHGVRSCTDKGLAPCDATVPQEETCNGADDDCDGETDEATCDDDNPCTDDGCVAGECLFTPNQSACDDFNPCTIDDKCSQGHCQGTLEDCDDSNICTDDYCQQSLAGEPVCKHDFNSLPCDGGKLCVEGVCSCVPDCEGKECGPDGCGGSCIGVLQLCEKQIGVCQGAVKNDSLCTAGVYLPCDTATYYWHNSSYEEAEASCDSKDNDCDEQVDEQLGSTTCGLGQCEHTVENCMDGEIQICNPVEGKSEEICDGVDNNCNGVPDENMGTTTCGTGMCFHTVQNCWEGSWQVCDPFQGAQPEVLDGVDNDCDGEADEGFPVPGAIIITELMANPDCAVDDLGEWVEIHNKGSEPWDLNGWSLKDNDNDKITIDAGGPLVIEPGQYLVLGCNGDIATNGGVALDYVYNINKFQLANSATGDECLLVGPGGVVVDEVWWAAGQGFPDFGANKGRSIALKVAAYDHADNDSGGNWFASTQPIPDGCGDKGSPGAANEQ